MIENLYQHAPCKSCPFRKGNQCLSGERAEEIASDSSFVCHNTVDYSRDAKGVKGDMSGRKQCAGHMLLCGDSNQFVQLAARMSIVLELSGRDVVYQSRDEFIEGHS